MLTYQQFEEQLSKRDKVEYLKHCATQDWFQSSHLGLYITTSLETNNFSNWRCQSLAWPSSIEPAKKILVALILCGALQSYQIFNCDLVPTCYFQKTICNLQVNSVYVRRIFYWKLKVFFCVPNKLSIWT